MAGINGAMDSDGMQPLSRGLFGQLARAQYGALVRLRWRIFVNGLRSKAGVFEFGARTVSYFVYALMGAGLAFGAGGISYGLASDRQWKYMPLVFWFVMLTWQVVPVMLASFQEQFNLGTLLRFPVNFRTFCFLYVVFGLSDVSTVIGALCSFGILIGITVVRPDLFGYTVLVLLVFAVFNILLVRAVFAWIDRWLSQRKTREILAAFFMISFLSFQLMNPAVWQHGKPWDGGRRGPQPSVQQIFKSQWARGANAVQEWLPPGLAGLALRDASQGQYGRGLGLLAGLGLFAVAAGGFLSLRLKAEFRGEDLSAAPARTKSPQVAVKPAAQYAAEREQTLQNQEGRGGTPSVLAAIWEKEARSLMRALPLIYAVGAPTLMVLVFSGVWTHGNLNVDTPVFAFPLCVFFAQVGFHQLWGNSFGTEGAGVQLYFLSPTPLRTVLLGKNLFHSCIFAIVMIVAGLLATVRLGAPSGDVLAMTVAWLIFVLPCNLAMGNIFSLTMPYKINPGRISRQRRSQGAAFLSLLLQVGLVGVGALVYLFSSAVKIPLLAVPILLVMAAAAALVWLKILSNTDNAANQRKELLIAVLTKADD